ncbi:leucine rich repeats (6 copies) domain-containing protein [Ditylenchus destructor]|uniref:Leucine rich repeats (6 copies) domain-containing protein n=1 Tax=Ditylenchus destructor TaxID=166010 RepID=A0AAD4NA40_9BILA|nr:leucine rich repeats (6 copies) domain-containing protein [Ditylenchus destructor]
MWLHFPDSVVGHMCPAECECSPESKSVICTCHQIHNIPWFYKKERRNTEKEHSQFVLRSVVGFAPFEIQHFVVHSCARLIIHSDAFAGAEITDQLKFVDIRRIDISPHAFRGFVKCPRQIVIQNSNIDLLPAHSFDGLHNIEHFWWRNVTIDRIKKLAFAKLSNIKILSIRQHAIYGSILEELKFVRSWIKSIASFAFSRNSIESFTFDETEIVSLGSKVFELSQIGDVLIRRTTTHSVNDEAFSRINAHHFEILFSTFEQFPVGIFRNTTISSMSITDTKFSDYFNESMFEQVHIDAFLTVSRCEFLCHTQDCSSNALLLEPSVHELVITFDNNRCNSTESICHTPEKTIEIDGLVCQRRGQLIEECVCVDTFEIGDDKAKPIYMPISSRTALILGDCPYIIINASTEANSSRTNQFLYLYRIGLLEFVSADRNLKQLHILNSNVAFTHVGAFRNLDLDQVKLAGSVVSSIEESVFESTHISLLTMNASTVHKIDQNAFPDSYIDSVELWNTKIVLSSGDMLNHAHRLWINDSELPNRNSYDVIGSASVPASICSLNNGKNVSSDCKCSKSGGPCKRCASKNRDVSDADRLRKLDRDCADESNSVDGQKSNIAIHSHYSLSFFLLLIALIRLKLSCIMKTHIVLR